MGKIIVDYNTPTAKIQIDGGSVVNSTGGHYEATATTGTHTVKVTYPDGSVLTRTVDVPELTTELNNLSNVNVPTPSDGDVLYWDNTAKEWKSKQVQSGTTINKLSDVADVDVTGLSDGMTIYWDATSSKWKVKTAGGTTVAKLGDITNVDTSAKAEGTFIMWDGSKWVAKKIDQVPTPELQAGTIVSESLAIMNEVKGNIIGGLAFDSKGETATFSVAGADSNKFSVDNGTGYVRATNNSSTYIDGKSYSIDVTLTTPKGSVTKTYTIVFRDTEVRSLTDFDNALNTLYPANQTECKVQDIENAKAFTAKLKSWSDPSGKEVLGLDANDFSKVKASSTDVTNPIITNSQYDQYEYDSANHLAYMKIQPPDNTAGFMSFTAPLHFRGFDNIGANTNTNYTHLDFGKPQLTDMNIDPNISRFITPSLKYLKIKNIRSNYIKSNLGNLSTKAPNINDLHIKCNYSPDDASLLTEAEALGGFTDLRRVHLENMFVPTSNITKTLYDFNANKNLNLEQINLLFYRQIPDSVTADLLTNLSAGAYTNMTTTSASLRFNNANFSGKISMSGIANLEIYHAHDASHEIKFTKGNMWTTSYIHFHGITLDFVKVITEGSGVVGLKLVYCKLNNASKDWDGRRWSYIDMQDCSGFTDNASAVESMLADLASSTNLTNLFQLRYIKISGTNLTLSATALNYVNILKGVGVKVSIQGAV